MSNINFKTYVTNTFKPYLCALRDKIDHTYSLMFERVKRQDELVRQTQELFSQNLEVIQQIRTKMIEYETFVESIKNNQATEAEVARLSKQVKELNYLYGVVLDIVYDLKYKENSSVQDIATQLDMREDSVLEALSEMVAIV